jgi:hypothetical protein
MTLWHFDTMTLGALALCGSLAPRLHPNSGTVAPGSGTGSSTGISSGSGSGTNSGSGSGSSYEASLAASMGVERGGKVLAFRPRAPKPKGGGVAHSRVLYSQNAGWVLAVGSG